MLHEPRARRPYRQIADQILALSAADGLAAGDRLPAERDLADRFGVSRPSLREALIALEVEGHVEIRMGSGIYLSALPGHHGPAIAAAVDDESPFEILQARAVIESAIAEECARLADAAVIARLDQLLDQMAGALDDRATSIRLDGEFHVSIAAGSGNAMLRGLTADIYRKRLSPFFTRLAGHFEGRETWRQALAEHGAIRDAITARDPAAAREAMRHHLTQSGLRFTASFAAETA